MYKQTTHVWHAKGKLSKGQQKRYILMTNKTKRYLHARQIRSVIQQCTTCVAVLSCMRTAAATRASFKYGTDGERDASKQPIAHHPMIFGCVARCSWSSRSCWLRRPRMAAVANLSTRETRQLNATTGQSQMLREFVCGWQWTIRGTFKVTQSWLPQN